MKTVSFYETPLAQEEHPMGPVVQVLLDDPRARVPHRQHAGDAGFDLHTLDEHVLQPRSFTDIATGISVKLPAGYWARITGRSSTVRTWHLQVQEAIIDNDYVGPMFVGVWNLNDHAVCVPADTRLAQVILHRLIVPAWEVVETLPETSRGANGMGSTGK